MCPFQKEAIQPQKLSQNVVQKLRQDNTAKFELILCNIHQGTLCPFQRGSDILGFQGQIESCLASCCQAHKSSKFRQHMQERDARN